MPVDFGTEKFCRAGFARHFKVWEIHFPCSSACDRFAHPATDERKVLGVNRQFANDLRLDGVCDRAAGIDNRMAEMRAIKCAAVCNRRRHVQHLKRR